MFALLLVKGDQISLPLGIFHGKLLLVKKRKRMFVQYGLWLLNADKQ